MRNYTSWRRIICAIDPKLKRKEFLHLDQSINTLRFCGYRCEPHFKTIKKSHEPQNQKAENTEEI